MNKNSLYRDLTTLGSHYALALRMKDSPAYVDWTEHNFKYVQYNPRKNYNRDGLSITSLDGGLSGRPDLDSVYEYNKENGTAWTERDFKVPTPAYEWPALKNCLKPFEGHIFRTHILKLNTGGFFPPHRDHPDEYDFYQTNKVVFDTFRLIMPLQNCAPPGMSFILEDKILQWEQGVLYFVDTAKIHYLFNTSPNPAYWLVVNIDVNEQTLQGVCKHMMQR